MQAVDGEPDDERIKRLLREVLAERSDDREVVNERPDDI
jgi:hypothetical protein